MVWHIVTLTSEICCLNSEHQQSCSCDGCCGYGIHVHATKNYHSDYSSRSIHETDASEKEEQRETSEEVKGVVASDSSRACATSKASGNYKMEIKAEIKISKLMLGSGTSKSKMLVCSSHPMIHVHSS